MSVQGRHNLIQRAVENKASESNDLEMAGVVTIPRPPWRFTGGCLGRGGYFIKDQLWLSALPVPIW